MICRLALALKANRAAALPIYVNLDRLRGQVVSAENGSTPTQHRPVFGVCGSPA